MLERKEKEKNGGVTKGIDEIKVMILTDRIIARKLVSRLSKREETRISMLSRNKTT